MLKSIVKIALQSRKTSIKPAAHDESIVILANGPSLADTIALDSDKIRHTDCMAVNFAANTDSFFDLKPRYYIMADPHFFTRTEDPNVAELYRNLEQASWPLTLIVPRQYKGLVASKFKGSNIDIKTFNFIGLEGPVWFERFCFRHRLGMPRPRNVLIPAIMCSIWLGYKDIKVAGADHSWLRSIGVDDDNHVVSVQPHFYKEDEKEKQRIRQDYQAYHLHDILLSFYIAFKSYFKIRYFADKCGIKITNVTPGSYIDAFERGKL